MRKYLLALALALAGNFAQSAPLRVTDVLAMKYGEGGIIIYWTAPYTSLGVLTELDVRYSTTPINALNWASRPRVPGTLDPGVPYEDMWLVVNGFVPGQLYYIALKNKDSTWSTMSNVSTAVAGGPDGSVILAWDPSPDASVVGYKLHYGVASGTYEVTVDVGNVTQATIPGLLSGVTYYFVATAYDGAGLESDYSNEVEYTPP